MATLTVRGCDEALDQALKAASARRGVSVNRLIIETLRESFLGRGKRPRRYDDLDALAGSWSAAEASAFAEAVAPFEEIDRELWRP